MGEANIEKKLTPEELKQMLADMPIGVLREDLRDSAIYLASQKDKLLKAAKAFGMEHLSIEEFYKIFPDYEPKQENPNYESPINST